MRNQLVPKWMTWSLFRGSIKVMPSCQPLCRIRLWISRKPLEIEARFQWTTNRKMAYRESNGHMTDDVTWPRKVKLASRDPSALTARSWNSWRCYLATVANYYSLLWAVWLAILAMGDSLASCYINISCIMFDAPPKNCVPLFVIYQKKHTVHEIVSLKMLLLVNSTCHVCKHIWHGVVHTR